MSELFHLVFSPRILSIFLVFFALPLLASPPTLPRYTEEREAAALHFVKKHLPESIPLLEELRKNHRSNYEQEIREIFQVTEILADLQDEPKRYELELKFWKTENKALMVVARLSLAKEEEKSKLGLQLREMAKELIDLDLLSLEIHAQMLEKEIQETREEVTRIRENIDKTVKDRYESLLAKVKKRKK